MILLALFLLFVGIPLPGLHDGPFYMVDLCVHTLGAMILLHMVMAPT